MFRAPYIAAGIVVAVLALIVLPTWLAWAVVGVLVAAPIVGYFALDRSQRRRLHRTRRRGLR